MADASNESGSGQQPSEAEDYLSDRQLAYFRQRLLDWREELMAESRATINAMRSAEREVGDEADHSSQLEIQTLELRTRDRYRKLIGKIDAALARIRDGSYGYCELTGEPIGLGRLEARPIANLSVFAQEKKEQRERRERYEKVNLSLS
ncbi:MAG: RNA polymerase-binding protein DksA [Pseudomonadota bacterium]